MVVGLCIGVLDFSKVAKNQALVSAVQAQHDDISNLIVVDLGFYGVVWSPQCHCDVSPGDKSACKRSPCNLKLRSMQQV